MSTNTSALRQFRAALGEGDLEQSIALFDDVSDEIDVRSERAVALQTLVRSVVARADVESDVYTSATQLMSLTREADEQRLSLGYYFLALVDGSATADDVATVADDLLSTRNRVDEQTQAVLNSESNLNLPPNIAVVGPEQITIPLGSSLGFDVRLENLSAQGLQN